MSGYNPVDTTPNNSGLGDTAPVAFSKGNAMAQELFERSSVVSVGAIGDSITQKNQLLFDLNGHTAASLYAITDRTWQVGGWLIYGAMRSQSSWFAWDFNPGYSGGTTATILSTVLPCFLQYPNGLPRACVVLGGTNDVGGTFVLATTLANLKMIYQGLIGAGVMPIAMTIPPRADFPANVLRLNLGIMRLAQEMGIPYADSYSLLVNPADGTWLSANLTYDNVHPTALACDLIGYALNVAIREWFQPASNKVMTAVYGAALGTNLQNVDPMLLTHAGTLNATSSYPNSTPWGTPGTPAMCTVNSSAGTEPGTGFTMRQGSPSIIGSSLTPNYLGNSFSIAGAGSGMSYSSNNSATFLTYAVGDRVALSFNVKAIMQQAQSNAGTWQFNLLDNTLGEIAGFFYGNAGGSIVVNGQAQIGNETSYPAGSFYTEITIPAGAGGTGSIHVTFSTTAGGSNVGDSVTFANVVALNLTQLGIVSP